MEGVDGIEYNLNEAISDLAKKVNYTPLYKKKWFIALIIGGSILIVAAIIVLIIFLKKLNEMKGEIICEYDVSGSEKKINILSKEFDKGNNDINIIINGEKIDFSKEYEFSNAGKNKVTFQIYHELDMTNMFKEVKNLVSIDLSSDANGKITSMQSAFENCEKLKYFKMSGFNLDNLKSTSRCFYHSNVDKLNLDFLSSAKIEDMSYMFAFYEYYSLDLSHLNTKYVKNMSHMFYGSRLLETIITEGFDTSNVEDMSSMFQNCPDLRHINFSFFTTPKVKNMSAMFSGCSNLYAQDFSKINTENVIDMSYMFEGNEGAAQFDLSYICFMIALCLKI